MKLRKLFPLLFMLISGATAWLVGMLRHFETHIMLIGVLVCMVVFGILGAVLRWLLDYFDKRNEEAEAEAADAETDGSESGDEDDESEVSADEEEAPEAEQDAE